MLLAIFSTASAKVILFSENFESGIGNWQIENNIWQVGIPSAGPISTPSGTHCAATVLNGNYAGNNIVSRFISPEINLAAPAQNEEIHLRFWQWLAYSYNSSGGWLQISTYNDTTQQWSDWMELSAGYINNDSRMWTPVDFDLTRYAGQKVRIGFNHDPASGSDLGWYIDDVQIVTKVPEFEGGFESGWDD